MKNKPQLSLFPNTECVECGAKTKNNAVTCNDCTDKWTKKHANSKK